MGNEQSEIDSLIEDENVIVLMDDPTCDMAEVHLNGEEVFLGNYGDFHPECQGNILPEKYQWQGRSGLVNALQTYITDCGKKVTVEEQGYSYEEAHADEYGEDE